MVRRTGLDQSLAPPLAASLTQELREAHCGQLPEPLIAGMFRVQRARDAMMADRLATVAGRAGGVLIAGNGHVRNDWGVPWYLARIRPTARTLSVGMIEVRDGADGRARRAAVRLRLVHGPRSPTGILAPASSSRAPAEFVCCATEARARGRGSRGQMPSLRLASSRRSCRIGSV